MLDVHLPHKPIHGFWEFLIHLFTITVGLLIATQIESCMEWRHHVNLAEQARASLRTEVETNLKELTQLAPGLKAWREQVDADLKTMQRIQEHPKDPKAQHASLNLTFSMVTMPDTAWKTAQTTGALGYMPYEEAERYSGIYQAQAALLALQNIPMEDVAGVNGLLAKYHWYTAGKISTEQASAVAEKLGQMRLHLSAGNSLLQVCIEQDRAFLENREPRSNYSETLR